MDSEMKAPVEQKDPMDPGIKAQEAPVEREKLPMFNESDFAKNGLVDNMLIVRDPDMSKMLCQSVLDQYQSQGAQKFERRHSSALIEGSTFKEQLENRPRPLEGLTKGTTKSGAKLAKPISEYLDKNVYYESLSEQIKDNFTSLNLKHSAVIPEDFKIYVDCMQFKSSEIKVEIKDDVLVVHARHQHKFDDHGMIRREFTRRWSIPEDVKQDKVSCLLDRFNILTIRAPRKPTSIIIPVQIESLKDWKTTEV